MAKTTHPNTISGWLQWATEEGVKDECDAREILQGVVTMTEDDEHITFEQCLGMDAEQIASALVERHDDWATVESAIFWYSE